MNELEFEFDTPETNPGWYGGYSIITNIAHIYMDNIYFDFDDFIPMVYYTISHETIHYVVHMIAGLDATDMLDNLSRRILE